MIMMMVMMAYLALAMVMVMMMVMMMMMMKMAHLAICPRLISRTVAASAFHPVTFVALQEEILFCTSEK